MHILKSFSLITFLIFTVSGLSAGNEGEGDALETGIKWLSIEEALAQNQIKPKKIFIDVYTDWCGWCKKMDATTFQDPQVVRYMNENFYSVKLNAEMKEKIVLGDKTYVNPNPEGRRSSHELAVQLLQGKMSYPSYVFMNENNQVLTVVKGYQQTATFQPILQYFGSNEYLTKTWEEYTSSSANK